MKSLDEWVDELRAHRKQLAGELARVDSALAALDGSDRPTASSRSVSPPGVRSTRESSGRTYQLLRSIMARRPSEPFTAESALDALLSEGWESEAGDPVNALRTALSRMAKRGEIHRVGRGEYAFGPIGQAADTARPKPPSFRWDATGDEEGEQTEGT